MTDPLARVPLVARCTLPSPAGPMTALATSRGLAALLFGSDRQHPDHHPEVPQHDDHPHLAAARAWLQAYWGDRPPASGNVTLDLHGTPFQQAVWQALLRIPFGQTRSYADIAREVGVPAAPRAAGGAIGRNPVAVLVPCHRVVGRQGALTGYASGLPLKVQLLRHEGVLA